MVRWMAAAFIMLALSMPCVGAAANGDPLILKRQEALLSKRADVQFQIQKTERRLHQIELDRKDKLEELDGLYRAHSDLVRQQATSSAIENEIAEQTRILRNIEQQRSDCLEELDGLFCGLSQINREVAECARELR